MVKGLRWQFDTNDTFDPASYSKASSSFMGGKCFDRLELG